jgi:hypothetical protein
MAQLLKDLVLRSDDRIVAAMDAYDASGSQAELLDTLHRFVPRPCVDCCVWLSCRVLAILTFGCPWLAVAPQACCAVVHPGELMNGGWNPQHHRALDVLHFPGKWLCVCVCVSSVCSQNVNVCFGYHVKTNHAMSSAAERADHAHYSATGAFFLAGIGCEMCTPVN